MKRKKTRSERLHDQAQAAAEMDQRRQDQISRQLTLINRLLLLQKATQTFMGTLDGDVPAMWDAYLAHVTSEPCAICGDRMNHYGEPHGVVTGDGKTRADVAAPTAVDASAVGLEERDAEPVDSPTPPPAT